MNNLTKKGYRNTTIIRRKVNNLPSKIKKDGYENAYKNNILIQKYHDKKDILFLLMKDLYNIKNNGVDAFDQYL